MLALNRDCHFPGLFGMAREEIESVSIGYFRADYNGYRWYDTVFPSNRELATDELIQEFNKLYFDTIEKFTTLDELVRFCEDNAERVGSRGIDIEYNLYAEGKFGYYWLRITPRKGDYNLRIRCYSKAEIKRKKINVKEDPSCSTH